MALDTRIPLMAAQPRNSLTDSYVQAMQLKGMQQQMQAQEAAQQRETQRANLLRQYVGADGAFDSEGASSALMAAGDIEQGIALGNAATNRELLKQKGVEAKRKALIAEIDTRARIIGSSVDQQTFDSNVAKLESMGVDVSGLRGVPFTPDLVKSIQAQALDAKAQIEIGMKQQAAKETADYREKQLGFSERRTAAAERSANREPMVEIYDPQSPTGTSYVPRSLAAGRPGKPASGGITVGMDENGNPIVQVGGPAMPGQGGNMPLDKTNAKEAQKDVITGMGTLERLDSIANEYKADYLTYGGRIQGAIGGMADKAGIASKDQKAFIQGRRAFTQKVDQEFNAYRKDITGAAAAMAELKDLKKAMINTDLSPAEFEAAYTTYRDSVARMLRLKQRILREGVPVGTREFNKRLDNAWVAGEDDSADDRGMELEAQGLPETEVLRRLKAEGYRQ